MQAMDNTSSKLKIIHLLVERDTCRRRWLEDEGSRWYHIYALRTTENLTSFLLQKHIF